mmetsp:Transcript_41967/g.130002  ORF Transcript_41967/g.130002 Transcript_41967/m.130002 type:complete len:202 (+) Transcript_41967:479-1084(+)
MPGQHAPLLHRRVHGGGRPGEALQGQVEEARRPVPARLGLLPEVGERGGQGPLLPAQLLPAHHPPGPQAPERAPEQRRGCEGHGLRPQQAHGAAGRQRPRPRREARAVHVRGRGHVALHGPGGCAIPALHGPRGHLLIRAHHVVHVHRPGPVREAVRRGCSARPGGVRRGQGAAAGCFGVRRQVRPGPAEGPARAPAGLLA